jgi:hypothetical protein
LEVSRNLGFWVFRFLGKKKTEDLRKQGFEVSRNLGFRVFRFLGNKESEF